MTTDTDRAPERQVPVRIVYRSYGGENRKDRVAFYSKETALLSLVRAARAMPRPAEILFVNDGPIPAPRREIMDAAGRVVTISAGSNRRSYRWAVAHAAAAPGTDEELVWFAEDDYLYRPDALTALAVGAAALPDGDYFSLYGSGAVDPGAPRRSPRPRELPGSDGDPGAMRSGGAVWYRALSTTSTFGVRRRVLRQDARLLRLSPLTGGAWDHATCLLYQGLVPFGPREIADDLRGPSGTSRSRSALRGLVRSLAVPRAWRRPSRRRVLLGADPELIRHMETGAPGARPPESAATRGTDWEGLARETRRWAVDAGFPVSVEPDDPAGGRR